MVYRIINLITYSSYTSSWNWSFWDPPFSLRKSHSLVLPSNMSTGGSSGGGFMVDERWLAVRGFRRRSRVMCLWPPVIDLVHLRIRIFRSYSDQARHNKEKVPKLPFPDSNWWSCVFIPINSITHYEVFVFINRVFDSVRLISFFLSHQIQVFKGKLRVW